ncbi:Tn3 family transposase [Actinopolyspora saharensis]|uniref:Tn3 family transposase n=1 Tax=Actinopolyspora saharensis TaxID=995062 RepID=UPI003F66CA9A
MAEKLILCIFGYGTNIGLRSIAGGEHGHTEDELRYVRRRYLSAAGARSFAAAIANATFTTRQAASSSSAGGASSSTVSTAAASRVRGTTSSIAAHTADTSHPTDSPSPASVAAWRMSSTARTAEANVADAAVSFGSRTSFVSRLVRSAALISLVLISTENTSSASSTAEADRLRTAATNVAVRRGTSRRAMA